MEKLTYAELAKILIEFRGTTFISIHSVTPNTKQFGQSFNGIRTEKMENLLGFRAEDIRKEAEHNFMLTSCGFDTMIEKARSRQFEAELEFLGIDSENFIKAIECMKADNYVLAERMNGTSVNPYLVLSAKDAHPMINVYPSNKNRKSPTFWVNGKEIAAETLAPYKLASYGKPSTKQIAYGIDPENTVKINNFRFQNLRHITMNHTRYEIVAR